MIGTHRLLQGGIEFANLGLVIIDEEQRFGVTHKERLKRMRLEVDVLSLSATPIPRTLHMALTGIRDMSTIDTPPEGRQPVQTYVAEWDDALVREAILHELERGGQVYVVHNRVQSIDVFADRLRALVPEARVAVGHGQMPESLLKRVMERFADGEFDVLVCTTIIESGIDIPNVNTLIVDNAGSPRARAALPAARPRRPRARTRPTPTSCTPATACCPRRRSSASAAIFEANELGAGFQVALRDLEIRGAGNLLGAEQSGHIASVGFDLYTKMLAEAVESMRAAHERPRTRRSRRSDADRSARPAGVRLHPGVVHRGDRGASRALPAHRRAHLARGVRGAARRDGRPPRPDARSPRAALRARAHPPRRARCRGRPRCASRRATWCSSRRTAPRSHAGACPSSLEACASASSRCACRAPPSDATGFPPPRRCSRSLAARASSNPPETVACRSTSS